MGNGLRWSKRKWFDGDSPYIIKNEKKLIIVMGLVVILGIVVVGYVLYNAQKYIDETIEKTRN